MFIECLQEDEENVRRNFDAAQSDEAIGRPRPIRELQRDADIAAITEALDDGRLQLFDFLENASDFYNPVPRIVSNIYL